MRAWFQTFLSAAKSWSDDNAFKHCAAVSFYTLFSLAPITLIAVEIAGVFFGHEVANRQLQAQIAQLVGPASAEMVQKVVEASATHPGSWFSTTIGIGVLVIGATTVFGQLQNSLNEIWNVRTKPSRSGWIVLIVQRLISFAMVVTVGFLLLVSLVLTTALTAFSQRFGSDLAPVVAKASDFVGALGVITVLFALVFKILPDVQLRWRDVWSSALITALLFTAGRYLIALYLGHSAVASVYGAAGSLVALLIWVYYSSAIMFFGVELVRARRVQRHLPLIPKKTAVAVREEVVHERPLKRAAAGRSRVT